MGPTVVGPTLWGVRHLLEVHRDGRLSDELGVHGRKQTVVVSFFQKLVGWGGEREILLVVVVVVVVGYKWCASACGRGSDD